MFSVQIYTLSIYFNIYILLLSECIKLWENTISKFDKYPSQQKVILKLLKLGLAIGENKKIYSGDVEINMSSLAKSLNTDRRVIISTIENILKDEELKNIFLNIKPAGPMLSSISESLGLGVVEIEGDAEKCGILSNVTKILANNNISIIQAYATDPYLTVNPHLILITDKLVSGQLIQSLLKVDGVDKVSIY